MKKCTHCKVVKSFDDFHKKSKSKDGRQNICKECTKSFSQKYYLSHTESHRNKTKLTRRLERKEQTELVRKIKFAYGCQLCDEKEPCCLEFHHKGDKEFNIGDVRSKGIGKLRFEREVKKCVVLCSNCHKKVHAGLLSVEGCDLVTQW